MDRLNEDLQHLNLYADYPYKDDKKRFCINIIGRAMNLIDYQDILTFEYIQNWKNIDFKSNIDGIAKYLDTYKIKFFYGSPEHSNIESALKDDIAQRWIKKLINKANK